MKKATMKNEEVFNEVVSRLDDLPLETWNDVVSINKSENPLVSIVGTKTDDDKQFVSYNDLGDMDNSRKTGVDAAYAYICGKPGNFTAVNGGGVSRKKMVVYSGIIAIAAILSTMFAMNM